MDFARHPVAPVIPVSTSSRSERQISQTKNSFITTPSHLNPVSSPSTMWHVTGSQLGNSTGSPASAACTLRPAVSASATQNGPATLPWRMSLPGPTILARLRSTSRPHTVYSTAPSSMMPTPPTSSPLLRPPLVASSPTFDELAREVEQLRQQLRARESPLAEPSRTSTVPTPLAWYHRPPSRSDFETNVPPPDVSTINASRELSAVAPSGPVPVSMPVPFQIQNSLVSITSQTTNNSTEQTNLNHVNQNSLPRAESFSFNSEYLFSSPRPQI